MEHLTQANLVEVLAEWGAHEAKGRNQSEVQFDLNDKFACADYALRFRAPLISAILKLEPIGTALYELNENESNAVVLFDRRNIDQWIQDAQNSNGKEWEHFQTMVDAETPPKGPLIASAKHEQSSNTIGPLILWDGWHRAAAWYERCRIGKPSCISCYLIFTANAF